MPRRNLYTLTKSGSPITNSFSRPRCPPRNPEAPLKQSASQGARTQTATPRFMPSDSLTETSQFPLWSSHRLRGGFPGHHQVRDQARVGPVAVFLVRSAQHRRRVDGADHQPAPRPERGLFRLALVLADPVPRAAHGFPRYRPQQHHQPGPDRPELLVQPEPACPDLARVRTLVDPALAPLGPLEVLNRVGHVHVVAVDAGLVQRPVQDPARGPDERMAPLVFLVTRLLADQRHGRTRPAFAEHRLRRALVQVASVHEAASSLRSCQLVTACPYPARAPIRESGLSIREIQV